MKSFDFVGLTYAIGAFVIWGLSPIYWKQFKGFDPFELLAHRVFWSSLLLFFILGIRKEFNFLYQRLRDKRTLVYSLSGTFLISINWWLFIWSVANGHIVEVSIGYFVNPILSVFLGVFILGERLRPIQWACVTLVALAIIIFAANGVGEAWISISLALSFGLYGVVKKKAPMPAMQSLFFDTTICTPFALLYFFITSPTGELTFLSADLSQKALAMGTFFVTVTPLLGFVLAVQRLQLSTVGLTQYIAPSLQLLLGVWLYGESFKQTHLYSFGLIWISLILFSLEAHYYTRKVEI